MSTIGLPCGEQAWRELFDHVALPFTRQVPPPHPGVTHHDRPTRQARLVRGGAIVALGPFLRFVPINHGTISRLQRAQRIKMRRERPGITTEVLELDGVRAEAIRPADADGDAVLMYFHGGGFFSGSVESHRGLCEQLAIDSGMTVVSVEYRMLPTVSVAGSVRDAITAYRALLDRGLRVAVAGDSAGGYLAVKVAELAAARGLTAPIGLVAFSPLLSLDPDRRGKAEIPAGLRVTDPILPKRRIAHLRRLWLRDDDPIEGFEAPLHAHASVSCPAHLVTAGDELLRPEIEAFAHLLRRNGTPVDLHVWGGQVHAFPSFLDFIPEGAEAAAAAAAFVRRCVAGAESLPLVGSGFYST